MSDDESSAPVTEPMPLLPLRNSVLFPASVVPVNVGRARSVRLIEESFGQDRPTIGVISSSELAPCVSPARLVMAMPR